MNPSPDYVNAFPADNPCEWYPPYFYDYYTCFNPHPYNLLLPNCLPDVHQKRGDPTSSEPIKLEEGSHSGAQNSHEPPQTLPKKNSAKEQTKKSSPRRAQIQNQTVCTHPNKPTKHKVKYFDPSNAPVITSEYYNLVEGSLRDNLRREALKLKRNGTDNELDYP
jgi:hypothetical protein